jgi:hypothetical protein
MVEIGIMIAIIILGAAFAKRIAGDSHDRRLALKQTYTATAKAGKGKQEVILKQEADPARLKALEIYHDLAKEKLDVIKTAIAAGLSDAELDALDQRLEHLIGRDKLAELVEGRAPVITQDLLDNSVENERRGLRQSAAAKG